MCDHEHHWDGYCSAAVCWKCGDHKGLTHCWCGWQSSAESEVAWDIFGSHPVSNLEQKLMREWGINPEKVYGPKRTSPAGSQNSNKGDRQGGDGYESANAA